MSDSKALNAPYFSGRWCDPSGNLTPLAFSVVRALMNRTGYAPGISASDTSQTLAKVQEVAEQAQAEAGIAENDALLALLSGAAANLMNLSKAQDALDAANVALLSAKACEARALKALEMARELANVCVTTRAPRDGISSDESMTFSVMNRAWPSSHNPSSKA